MLRIFTDDAMVEESGVEYKIIPAIDLPVFRHWFKKTVAEQLYRPKKSFIIDKDNMTVMCHPDVLNSTVSGLVMIEWVRTEYSSELSIEDNFNKYKESMELVEPYERFKSLVEEVVVND